MSRNHKSRNKLHLQPDNSLTVRTKTDVQDEEIEWIKMTVPNIQDMFLWITIMTLC